MDDEGLDYIDHKMMNCIINQYNGGPVGLDTIAVSIEKNVLQSKMSMNPFNTKGFIERTPRGRKATPFAYEHFKKLKNEGII